jgi:hypothetical protein
LGTDPSKPGTTFSPDATAIVNDFDGANVVGIAGHRQTLKTKRRRDRQGLAQDSGRITEAAKAGANCIADMAPTSAR